MKKVVVMLLMLTLCLTPMFAFNVNAAESEAYPTSIWKPHNYMAMVWEIPTTMTYDGQEGSVTFAGSLNAGIATTGFTCTEPLDIEDFSIEMSFDKLPDPDKLSWVVFALFDRATITNDVNAYDVYAPFNLGDGWSYDTSPFQGLLVMLQPQGNGVFNILDIVAKNINTETGEYEEDSWNTYPASSRVSTIKLNSGNYDTVKMSITADDADGLEINFNDGAWKDENDNAGTIVNTGADLSAIRTYLSDESRDVYFQFVAMYNDGNHREIEITVNKLNGKKACDGTEPDYLADKVLTEGNISVTVSPESVGYFGVYPNVVDGLDVIKFDEEDDNYEAVIARAEGLDMEVVDYFKVVPKIGENAMPINSALKVRYTLPDTYDNYAIYYINTDDEVVSLPETLGKIEGNVATIDVDNSTITKIIILGGNNPEEPAKGCSCGSTITEMTIISIAMGLAVLILMKRTLASKKK